MDAAHLRTYVPRVLDRQLAVDPPERWRAFDGSVLFADVSGFTALSEKLARRGREGAEQLVDTIGGCFAELLRVAYANGGSLVKFGGDALLLVFEGEDHTSRACSSAVRMRRALRTVGRIDVAGAKATLRMSVGVHSGDVHLFLVGGSHRELILTGPAATAVTTMEKAADAGEIVVSPAAAARLPGRCVGAAKGPGRLLTRAPAREDRAPSERTHAIADELIAACIPAAVRVHVSPGPQPPEHRTVTVAFLRYSGTDAMIEREGPEATAAALDELVRVTQEAIDAHEATFLDSDVDADGGKLFLCAGAPRTAGHDAVRLLAALRRVAEAGTRLPVRIGVNRGHVFSGSVGPRYRHSYTVMGDTVNLAARVMGKAGEGQVLATDAVVEHAGGRFAATPVEPFRVKGKRAPVHAAVIGPAVAGAPTPRDLTARFPLLGRDEEIAVLEAALADAADGNGRLVEISGEAGVGRTRLAEEVRERAGHLAHLASACDPYAAATPYALWRELLHQAIGAPFDEAPDRVADRLRALVSELAPGLEPWVPLLAIPLGLELPSTPEVSELAPDHRQDRLHEAVIAFLRARLAQPVLIEVEDAHFMDTASGDLLAALARQLPSSPWLVVTTRREGTEGFVAPSAPGVVRLEPQPLAPEVALELAERVTDDAPLAPHVLRLAAARSGGNPQFLRDLLRAAAAGADVLPDTIEAAAMARIDRLPAGDRELVRRASVLGVSFHPTLLDEVLETRKADPEVWDRLHLYFELDGNGHARFRRALVRDVAYHSLAFRTRRRLHAAAGARMEADLGPSADEEAAVLSLHFQAAGDGERAWRYARIAGDRAAAQFAHADAAVLYARALDVARTVAPGPDAVAGVWESLGDARAACGELTLAQDAFAAARRLIPHDLVRSAGLMHRHADVAVRAGRADGALRWAGRGLRMLEGVELDGAAGRRAQLLATLATARQRQGRMREAITVCRSAIAAAEAAGEQRALAHACYVLDWALVESGRPAEAIHSPRALAIYEALGDLDRQAAVLNNLAGFAYRDGRWDEAISLYERAAEGSTRAGDAANAAFGDCGVGEVRGDQGHLAAGEESLRRALRVWRATDYAWGVAYAQSRLARLAARAGRDAEASELLSDARAGFLLVGARSDATFVSALEAEAWLFAGRALDAAEQAEQVLAADDDGASWTAPVLHRVRGCAYALLDDVGAARTALEEALAAAGAQGDRFEVALALDALERYSGASPERVFERDALVAELGIVTLPASPMRVAPGTPARRFSRGTPDRRPALAPTPR